MSSSAFEPAIRIYSDILFYIYRDRVTSGSVVTVQTQSHFCPSHYAFDVLDSQK